MDSAASASSPTRRLGQAVRARRKSLRLTQIEVSQLAGCGPDFVYDVELGKKATLRLGKVLDLLQVLGLELVLEAGTEMLRIGPSLPPPLAVGVAPPNKTMTTKRRGQTKRAKNPPRGSRTTRASR